ncbi:AbrB/MazE/SpoVT family DNA-binding domain-containing protein [Bacillus piscicola]|uniref:AbrB/MazE/SpoVT family DNA-binding domain-containing protein n=1 Tax=Bacillus piscicola TaxID=1632684 RepID=UPI001F0922F3|nr:AbrB/MazE/SpoVT family DNA-binding domain-containing protein [Bacillus piscicola]
MKTTGIVRKVDELGRVVIPIELRRTLEIAVKDPLEISVDDERIILTKYKPRRACQITGESSDQNLSLADGKVILSPEGAKILMRELEDHLEYEKINS